jgi:hypothetical protein
MDRGDKHLKSPWLERDVSVCLTENGVSVWEMNVRQIGTSAVYWMDDGCLEPNMQTGVFTLAGMMASPSRE